jgi:hypothetical protein
MVTRNYMDTRKIIKVVNLPLLLSLCSIVAICCHTASCPLITSPYQPAAAAGPSIAAAAAPVSLLCRITAVNIQRWQAHHRRPLSRVGKTAVLAPERLAAGAVASRSGGGSWQGQPVSPLPPPPALGFLPAICRSQAEVHRPFWTLAEARSSETAPMRGVSEAVAIIRTLAPAAISPRPPVFWSLIMTEATEIWRALVMF